MSKFTRKALADLNLEKEVINDIMALYGDAINPLKEELKEAKETKPTVEIPEDYEEIKAKVAELTTTLEAKDADLAKRDADIAELNKATEGNEALQAQIEKLQSEYAADKEKLEATVKKTKQDAMVNLALTKAKAKNSKAVKALLELGDDFSEEDLDEAIKVVQEENDYLFKQETAPVPPAEPAPTKEPGKKKPKIITPTEPNGSTENKPDVSKMTFGELTAYKKAHPDSDIFN
jgi:hypothetical protein